jgi:hypothetical protein
MKIISIDRKSWIEVKQHNDGSYSSFEVEVSIDIGHGFFSGKNIDIQFLNINTFIEELDSFILNRERTPRLEGTYDSFIEFSCPNNKRSLIVNFAVGDAYAGYSKTADYNLKGGFDVDQEYLQEVLGNFKKFEVS